MIKLLTVQSVLYMSNKVPESFFIYQELILKLAYQKAELKQRYESQIDELSFKMKGLVDIIEVQNRKLAESKSYIAALEEKLNKYKKSN